MLELARRRFAADARGISLRIGELDHLPLRDDEGDFVCINMVLHHLSDPLPALREIHRVIHPGGLLLVAAFDRHDHERMRTAYGDQWLGFDRETLSALLTQAGLTPEQYSRHPVEQGLALNLVSARKPA
jgi:ArsR family transcriptional regulator